MRVIGNEDGTFVFEFQPNEKQLGIDMLKSLRTNDPHNLKAIALSIQEILMAGQNPPSNAIN